MAAEGTDAVDVIIRSLAAAVAACRGAGDDALERLAVRLEAELTNLRYQRDRHDA
jgi:hypothetical protein